MLQLSGRPFTHSSLWPEDSIERKIVTGMMSDAALHSFETIDELRFELHLRINIIASAKAMNDSEIDFEIFSTSRCNPAYWILTETGGFQLRNDVLPSEAIQDVFLHGSSYGFECATAKVILLYNAVLLTIGKEKFNRFFQNLYLYSWHFDHNLSLRSIRTNHFLPGDIVYFKNPSVNPTTSWWRGENAVLLEDGTYFGHGVGIVTSEEMIQHLNQRRKPGSTISAYMMESAARPDVKHLYQLSRARVHSHWNALPPIVIFHQKNSISLERYLRYLYFAYLPFSNSGHHLFF